MAEFRGNLPFIVEQKDHPLLASNRGFESSHKSFESASNKSTPKCVFESIDKASDSHKKVKASQAHMFLQSFAFWHTSLGHSSKLNCMAYEDGSIIPPYAY